ncbi:MULTISPECIES: 3-hydroxybutyryl-CoA dehydrogenase [Streptomyces]|uniref:3-hydroxybutyryl-CoA dehydrogenase n=1 Tax=Streptomyces sp. NBC_00093 TaxID=2975649 RepID=A0AAU2ABK9_9ACTN
MTEEITRIGVVGSGIMGAGVAEVCGKAGRDVIVAVSSEASLETGPRRLERSLGRAVDKGRISREQGEEALRRVSFTTDRGALYDRQLVIEAVSEDEPLKLQIFAELDKIVDDPETILASITSSIPIVRLARATTRPDRVVGVHFFNPVPVLPLVEIVDSVLTDSAVSARAESFVSGTLGKTVIKAPDRAGFVVNAVLFPYLLSAIRMVDSGFATAETIDKGMTLGCSHPMGPLRLADLIGLDTVLAAAQAMYEESKEPHYAPPTLLLRLVEGGLLGRKSGRGFYPYDAPRQQQSTSHTPGS